MNLYHWTFRFQPSTSLSSRIIVVHCIYEFHRSTQLITCLSRSCQCFLTLNFVWIVKQFYFPSKFRIKLDFLALSQRVLCPCSHCLLQHICASASPVILLIESLIEHFRRLLILISQIRLPSIWLELHPCRSELQWSWRSLFSLYCILVIGHLFLILLQIYKRWMCCRLAGSLSKLGYPSFVICFLFKMWVLVHWVIQLCMRIQVAICSGMLNLTVLASYMGWRLDCVPQSQFLSRLVCKIHCFKNDKL